MMIYYAKSADEQGNRLTNQTHLREVADLAQCYGTEVNMPETARFSGLLHDFGKYSQSFQRVLQGTAANIDHAICAAAYLYYRKKVEKKAAYQRMATVMAAHHSALRAYEAMKPELREIVSG